MKASRSPRQDSIPSWGKHAVHNMNLLTELSQGMWQGYVHQPVRIQDFRQWRPLSQPRLVAETDAARRAGHRRFRPSHVMVSWPSSGGGVCDVSATRPCSLMGAWQPHSYILGGVRHAFSWLHRSRYSSGRQRWDQFIEKEWVPPTLPPGPTEVDRHGEVDLRCQGP